MIRRGFSQLSVLALKSPFAQLNPYVMTNSRPCELFVKLLASNAAFALRYPTGVEPIVTVIPCSPESKLIYQCLLFTLNWSPNSAFRSAFLGLYL